MSLPPELRVLCFQLSSTPVIDLPRLTPTLLSYVLRCQVPLSMPALSASKAEASSSAVLVHKLKTQLSALLNGRTAEGRFTAVILIKAVVEVGGWEILNGSESWVRVLLSILGKPDPTATKEMVIIALTKIYCMTHQYQTLVREITTPTLPAFVTACLALVSPRSSKAASVSSSIEETIFDGFAMLIPRHTSIFRPFASQIRLVVRHYLAPTSSDGRMFQTSVKGSARRVLVALHQTAAKNGGAEQWSKAMRELVKDIHTTADQVFRAVIEDWESNAGYASTTVDVNQELRGGGDAPEELPPWSGIFAGIERLIGLLEMLAVYLKEETSAPVVLPLGSFMDILNRMLSIAVPASPGSGASARFHPAIDREERDVLSVGLPQIYIAALQLVSTIAKRLEWSFLSVAQAVFDQLVWVFPFGRHDEQFRTHAYEAMIIVLKHLGSSFTRAQVGKCYDVLRSCCKDLEAQCPVIINDAASLSQKSHTSNTNVDASLHRSTESTQTVQGTALNQYASKLLATSLSQLPQQYVDISIRSMVERTAILSHNKDAMLASILYPFVGKNGKTMASMLPHLTREFGHDASVEILLRPRMPLLPSTATRPPLNDAVEEESDEDEEMLPPVDAVSARKELNDEQKSPVNMSAGLSGNALTTTPPVAPSSSGFGIVSASVSNHIVATQSSKIILRESHYNTDIEMTETDMVPKLNNGGPDDEESSSDESVHLTMQLDTDSEGEDGL